jgi:hypothetical protein
VVRSILQTEPTRHNKPEPLARLRGKGVFIDVKRDPVDGSSPATDVPDPLTQIRGSTRTNRHQGQRLAVYDGGETASGAPGAPGGYSAKEPYLISAPLRLVAMITPVELACELVSSTPAGTVPPSNRRFSRPEHEREGPQAELVYEPMLEQRLDQVRAAVHLKLGAVLLLERTDSLRNLAFDQPRVLPLELFSRSSRPRAWSPC